MRGARDLQRGLHCLDIFGASGRVKHTWEDAGFRAAGFDIRLSNSHDICGETGVKILLRMGLESLEVNFHTSFFLNPFYFAIKTFDDYVCQGLPCILETTWKHYKMPSRVDFFHEILVLVQFMSCIQRKGW